MKLIEENISSIFFDISLSSMFLGISLQARETKAKINKWDYIRSKRFCTRKENYQQSKKAAYEWEKIFVNYIPSKGLICKIYKELIQLNTHTQKPSKTTAKTVKKWADDLKRLFSKGDI